VEIGAVSLIRMIMALFKRCSHQSRGSVTQILVASLKMAQISPFGSQESSERLARERLYSLKSVVPTQFSSASDKKLAVRLPHAPAPARAAPP